MNLGLDVKNTFLHLFPNVITLGMEKKKKNQSSMRCPVTSLLTNNDN